MNSKAAISVALTICLTAAGSAFAQRYGDRNERPAYILGQHPDEAGNASIRTQKRRSAQQQQEMRLENQGYYIERNYRGQNRQFRRGDRFPAEYRHRNYVVNDWRGHRLSRPPEGHQWIQSGNDYVLIAIASGIIAQFLLNN